MLSERYTFMSVPASALGARKAIAFASALFHRFAHD